MVCSLLRAIVVLLLAGATACRKSPTPEPGVVVAPPPAQVSGTIALDGLTAPVTVTRDRWGIPHIVASNQHDLFFAQGFVQAQDRLFQMDLWRRSVQGRLAEVLGANFIERDAMTRRMQFIGNHEAEWASYGPDVRAIATAFVNGINAWVDAARERLPEEFALAGWAPESWVADDLLSRTDAFLQSRGADDELFRARLSGVVGPAVAAKVLGTEADARTDVDIKAINFFVGDMLRRVGTAPFFSGLFTSVPGARPADVPPVTAKPLPLPLHDMSSVAFALAASRSTTGAPLLAGTVTAHLVSPATRYAVHLQAPGWNVIGVTWPWHPGVAIGHNERAAWSFVPVPLDTQDVFVERINPANPRQVAVPGGGWRDMTIVPESVAVKGRKEPYDYEKQYTPHGVVIALDRERKLAYTLRWSGREVGGAAELAATTIGRAQSWREFRAALGRWKMPTAEFVYADVDGAVASQVVGLVPVRQRNRSGLPSAGWLSGASWRGWEEIDDQPRVVNPPDGTVIAVSDRRARIARLRERLDGSAKTPAAARAMLRDVVSWNAGQLIPLLAPLTASDPVVELARRRLLQWDRAVAPESAEALLYTIWEHALLRRLGSMRVPSVLLDEFVTRLEPQLVPALTSPASAWFDGDVTSARDALLLDSLAAATDDERRWTSADASATWGRFQLLTFNHPLAISPEGRYRYQSGPFAMGGYHGTVFATARTGADRSFGPAVEFVFDVSNWDASRIVVAPGQSASPDSPHYADFASLWSRGESGTLRFSESGVSEVAESQLKLSPRSPGGP